MNYNKLNFRGIFHRLRWEFIYSKNANYINRNMSKGGPEKCLKDVEEQRSLNVAVIGLPNAGKSTFINNLIKHRVCPTSTKVHTTQKQQNAILNCGKTQLTFCDTPGLLTKKEITKYDMNQTYKAAWRNPVHNWDMIMVIHDVSNSWTRNKLSSLVNDILKQNVALPSVLVLNKIDTLKSKRILLDTVRAITNDICDTDKFLNKGNDLNLTNKINLRHPEKTYPQLNKFSKVFFVSSLTRDGLDDILTYLLPLAKHRDWKYKSDIFTDFSTKVLIEEYVRARLLDYLPQEIPYNLKCETEYYNEKNGSINIFVNIICPSSRIRRLICGESNGRMRQITDRVTSDLVETFGGTISLTILTKSKNDV